MIKPLIGVLCVFLAIIVVKAAIDPATTAGASAPPPIQSAAVSVARPVRLASGADDGLAKAYVFAFASAMQAKARCVGMVPNESALLVLRMRAGLTDAGDDWLVERFGRVKPMIESALANSGPATWCIETWELLGPSGEGVLQASFHNK